MITRTGKAWRVGGAQLPGRCNMVLNRMSVKKCTLFLETKYKDFIDIELKSMHLEIE